MRKERFCAARATGGGTVSARKCSRLFRPGAIDRIFGHTLAFLVWICLIRGHFYVLEDLASRYPVFELQLLPHPIGSEASQKPR